MLRFIFKLRLLLPSAAITISLLVSSVVITPQLMFDRNLASIPQIRNWGLENNVGNSHIHALEAWKMEEGSHDIVVAVIDTGIDSTHPDLKNNLWHDPTTGIYGWDFVANKPNPIDDNGHGTHVAGILGATLNTRIGISGVAHQISIMPVKFYSNKNSDQQNLKNSIQALNWAIDHGAKIINYSGGGPKSSNEELAAIRRAKDKGILIVAAAGNENQNADLDDNAYYPCAYRLDNIVCVAAINIHNEILASSNWGKARVDVAAPGESILSTIPGAQYAYMSGTSQATPFVAGVAALLLAKDKRLTPPQIKTILRETVDHLPQLTGKIYSGGKINAAAALVAVEQMKTHDTAIAIADNETLKGHASKPLVRGVSSPKGKGLKFKKQEIVI